MLILSHLTQAIRSQARREPYGWRGAAALALDFRAANRYRDASLKPQSGEAQLVRQAVDAINNVGFFAIENFFSIEEVNALAATLRSTIDANPNLLHPSTPYDKRLHGVENVNSLFQKFTKNTMLHDVARCYLKEPTDVAFTLGAILEAAPGNPGSGGGWHRDNFTRQFKAMVYLSDVGPEDGAFQIIEKSHHYWHSVKDNCALGQTYGNSRMAHEAVMKMLDKTDKARLHTLTAKAGTVLLFDSSAIHRGSPILRGERIALTNYFFPLRDINNELLQHFAPVAGRCVR